MAQDVGWRVVYLVFSKIKLQRRRLRLCVLLVWWCRGDDGLFTSSFNYLPT